MFAVQDQSVFHNFENVTKKIDRFVSQGLCYFSTGFHFKICLRTRKVTGPFEKQHPGQSANLFIYQVDSCKGKVSTKEHKYKKLCFKYLNEANYVRSVILESENDILFTCNMNTSCLFVGSQAAWTYCRSIPARIH